MKKKSPPSRRPIHTNDYSDLVSSLTELLEEARHAAARSVNSVMTATYWEIGGRVVEYKQGGKRRAEYGAALLKSLSSDLTARFGRGFSVRNLEQMRLFYLGWPLSEAVPPAQSVGVSQAWPQKSQTVSAKSPVTAPSGRFPLPWSHYVRLISVEDPRARAFYETEALCGGWSVRQLDRQISTLFYERTALSRDKAAMLRKGSRPKQGETLTPEEEIKDPFVLEFLDLKDEYSESVLEEALIRHLEHFLLELGNDFTFVARQKRLRVGDEWYRIDLSVIVLS